MGWRVTEMAVVEAKISKGWLIVKVKCECGEEHYIEGGRDGEVNIRCPTLGFSEDFYIDSEPDTDLYGGPR